MPAQEPTRVQEKETGRLEAFSDGVFAIAITLLVLDLKIAPGLSVSELNFALADAWPAYFAFLISFISIGVMWINHHRLFTLIRKVDDRLLVLNTFLLLTVTVVPVPTTLVSAYLGHPGEQLAVLVYTFWGLVIALSYNLLWRHMANPNAGLLHLSYTGPQVAAINRQYKYGPFWYFIAIGATLVSPTLAMAICGGLILYFAKPPKMAS